MENILQALKNYLSLQQCFSTGVLRVPPVSFKGSVTVTVTINGLFKLLAFNVNVM